MQRSSLRRVGALTFGVSMVVMAAGTVGASSAPTEPAGTAPAGSAPTVADRPTSAATHRATSSTATSRVRRHHPFGEITAGVHRSPVRGRPRPQGPQLRRRDLRRRHDHRRWRSSRPTTDGIAYANEINGITRDGEKCTTSPTARPLIDGRHRPRLRRHLRPARVRRQRRAARGQLRRAAVRRQQPHRRSPRPSTSRPTAPAEARRAAGPGRRHPRR